VNFINFSCDLINFSNETYKILLWAKNLILNLQLYFNYYFFNKRRYKSNKLNLYIVYLLKKIKILDLAFVATYDKYLCKY